MPIDLQAYQASLQDSVYYPLQGSGFLRLSGRDRLTFVQRQTTNNTNLLSPETGQFSVLTSATARILDAFFVYLGQGAAAESLILLPGKPTETARYLKSRIFFMDQVSLADESSAYAQYIVDGPQAAAAIRSLGVQQLPLTDGVMPVELGGQPVTLIGWRGLAGPAYRLLAAAEAGPLLELALHKAGVPLLDGPTAETRRVEAGLPAGGQALLDEYNPLEVGLGYAISDNKGCYTGQEILARQLTYDKVTRQLAGLRLSEWPAALLPGCEVLADDRPAGKITSGAESPRFGPLALAVLKRPAHLPGTSVLVQVGEQQISGFVVELPVRFDLG